MRDIRFVSGDSESLILETLDGEKLRLTVDASVREATRKSPEGAATNNLSPREIQDSIRAGSSIEELAAASGDSIEFVKRFAVPVLEELAHMVASALAVRVEISPDRYNEARYQEFGELVAERLRNGGASNLTWHASRETPTTWLISVNYETPTGSGIASWSYEPRHLVLSPENETAVNLSNSATLGDAVIPKLLSLHQEAVVETEAHTADDNKVTDLLDAFKQRREAAANEEANRSEKVAQTSEPETEPEPEHPEFQELPDDEPKSEAPRKGRAPMPSWDEIVFGSKSED
jgi:hypothetical protein